jgi:hypothetical protein
MLRSRRDVFDGVDARAVRTVRQRSAQMSDRWCVALRFDFDTSVGPIPDDAREVQSPRRLSREPAEPDALHVPAHDDMHTHQLPSADHP